MADLELEKRPFFVNPNTNVKLFRGFKVFKDVPGKKLPIVVKKYDCTRVRLQDSVNEINRCLSEGLAQARVDHPHACKVLDVQIDITQDGDYCVSHVLEALDNDVSQVIAERKQANRPYTETELRTFLIQVGEALAYAHSKDIAHRDVKPANVFVTSTGEYKVGDFGAFWEKKRVQDHEMQSYTEGGMGTPVFMGPQMRQACSGLGVKYHTFKNDVYALGASALNLAALAAPTYLSQVDRLDVVVEQEVARLHLSGQLATLLRDMLSMAEDSRPTMEVVLQRLSSPVKIGPAVQREEVKAPVVAKKQTAPLPARTEAKTTPSALITPQLALLTRNEVRLFNFQSLSWGAPVALATPITCNVASSNTVIEGDRVLCCGGRNEEGLLSCSYLVEVRADQCPVTQLPNMTQGRTWPGVIHCEGATYVFGSDGGDGTTGEMLTFPPTWTPLRGHMNERRAIFSPCVYQRNIYLCGYGSRGMELFSLVRGCFERVEVQLPDTRACVLWVDGEHVTVVSWAYRMRVGSAPIEHPQQPFWVNSSAVVYGDSVYWVSKRDGSVCVRAGKGGFEEYEA